MDLFEVGDVDVAQQPKQGVGVRQGLQFGEQQPQVGLELGAGHLAVDLASGGELKDEHQQPVEQQHGEPVAALVGVARVGNLFQSGEQGGQLAAQDAHLSAHRRLAGLLFLGDAGVGRAGVGQGWRRAGEESIAALLLAQRLFLLSLVRALLLDLGA